MNSAYYLRYRLAMNYGTCLGLYYIAKFALLPLGLRMPFLELLFMILTLAVPVIGFIYTKQCRNRYLDGSITFLQALTFGFWMFAFASLLAAVGHYIYFAYIDNGFLLNTYEQLLADMKDMEQMKQLSSQFGEQIDALRQLSPIQLTLQMLFNNIYYGCLMSIPIALIAKRTK